MLIVIDDLFSNKPTTDVEAVRVKQENGEGKTPQSQRDFQARLDTLVSSFAQVIIFNIHNKFNKII